MDDTPSIIEQEKAPASSTGKIPKSKRSRRIVWIIVGIVILLIGAVAAWWLLKPKDIKDTVTQATVPAKEEVKVVEAEDTTPLGKFITPKTGETWLATPKQLPNLGLSPEGDGNSDGTSYYWEVGARAGNTIILRDEPVPGEYVRVFERTPEGAYRLVAQPISTALLGEDERGYAADDLRSDIQIDWETHYDSLSMPAELDLGQGERVTRTWGRMGSVATNQEGTKVTDVAKYGKSVLQRLEIPNADTGLANVGYRMLFPSGRAVTLNYTPVTEILETYRWDSGVKATVTVDGAESPDSLKPIARGCGYLQGVTIYPGVKKEQLEAVGTTDRGAIVYRLKDHEASLYRLAYNEYVEYMKSEDNQALTKAAFIEANAVVMIESPNNGWLVYVRNSFAPQYGCGKPVIYLYPTRTINVSVRVGADVTVSDPSYPVGGWREVTAEPSGQLTYQGRQYDSLFWEGTGYGPYPAITSGVIVARSEAVNVIEKQLRQQGLHQQEIDDFMAYWADKIPHRPYVRLTWLTQQQIDTLAPLYLSERPDTTIRVFLDMAGLDVPIFLAPQTLTAPDRRGFTVVEWGGLVNM